ncbi:MAG TPA: hypothetical protein VF791_24645 [Pyrinomonadaceae bacterium]
MWSIGIYTGESPYHLLPAAGISNPVLSHENVSDVPADFLADPFMVRAEGMWYMFFEVMNRQTKKGEIGLASSEDGLAWAYQQIVLSEPFHLSYPYVFEWQNEYYMIPETLQANAVRLYKAEAFPTQWSLLGSLVEGSLADPSIFFFENRWWIFACSTPYQHDTLRLYFASELLGHWTEHPANPIVEADKHRARPGGRVLVSGHKVIRFSQDCYPIYGSQVRAFEVCELTSDSYQEKESRQSPILKANGNGWNSLGMHHIDPHQVSAGQWIACVDGFSERRE